MNTRMENNKRASNALCFFSPTHRAKLFPYESKKPDSTGRLKR